LKKFLIFCIISILIGAIYIYPDVRFIAEEGKNFKGITLTGTADEAFYLARLNGVYKGDYRLANVGLYEHRNDPWLMPPYAEVIIGSIGKILKIPAQYLDIMLSFIFPVIIFWLIYLLAYYLSRSQRLGILTTSAILLGYALFSARFSILRDIVSLKYSQPLWFLRPYSPQMIYIPFILALVSIFLFIDSTKKSRLFLVALFIACTNYTHIYIWAFLFAGLGVWLIIAIFQKDTRICKNIIIIMALAIFLSMGYWINHYRVSMSPNYSFLKVMMGMEYTHRPIVPLAYILISSIILFCNRSASTKHFYFLLSFLLGGLVCLNQQIISGKIMQPGHFSGYANKTFLTIALISSLNKIKLFEKILEKISKRVKRHLLHVTFFLLICILFFLAFIQQTNYYHNNKKSYSSLQSIKGAMDWLNQNTKKEDVVLTDAIKFGSFASVRNLLLYTKNYHYLGFEASSLVSSQEKEERFLAAMRFFGYSLYELESILNNKGSFIFFGMSAYHSNPKAVKRYFSYLKTKYIKLMDEDPLSVLNRYKINYVLIGKGDHLFDIIEHSYPSLKKVFDDGSYKIIEIY